MIMAKQQYDGKTNIIHDISAGESLSILAGYYYEDVNRWRPIYVYNTKVRAVLGRDPDKVQVGTKVIIPRTLQGYDELIRKLVAMKDAYRTDADRIRFSLEKDYDEHQAMRVLIDFSAEIATFLGTCGVKVARAAASAKTAVTATGAEKPAAEYLAQKNAKEVGKYLETTAQDKAVDLIAAKAHEDAPGIVKDTRTMTKGVTDVRGISVQRGKSLLDIADIVLAYASPSNVADAFLKATVGETPKDSHQNAVRALRRGTESFCSSFEQKIAKLRSEKNTVWQTR